MYQRVCDWYGVNTFVPELRHAMMREMRQSHQTRRRPALSPMHLMTLPFAAYELQQLARAHATATEREAREAGLTRFVHARPPLLRGGTHSLLRLGLISGDFKRHPVSILLAPVLMYVQRLRPRPHLTLFALNPNPQDEWGALLRQERAWLNRAKPPPQPLALTFAATATVDSNADTTATRWVRLYLISVRSRIGAGIRPFRRVERRGRRRRHAHHPRGPGARPRRLPWASISCRGVVRCGVLDTP